MHQPHGISQKSRSCPNSCVDAAPRNEERAFQIGGIYTEKWRSSGGRYVQNMRHKKISTVGNIYASLFVLQKWMFKKFHCFTIHFNSLNFTHQLMYFYKYNKILVQNIHIRTLKNAPTCFDLIQIIFRELICSLLKLLIIKFVKKCKSQCGDAIA